VDAGGLTSRETDALDISAETAQTMSLIDEHTAVIQLYQQIGRLWSTRIAPGDPRLAWNEAHEAWVRTLAGDRLTAEQLLENKPTWLAAELGERHPYTRAVRLALAATLVARGATAEAASLRVQAERATRDLFQSTRRAPEILDDAPVPPGVLAHVAPNAPAREGFRPGKGSSFLVPLTSAERWIAGRDGWRLHLVTANTCRASVVTGTDPRLIAVNAARSPDGGWRVWVEGTKPAMVFEAAASETVIVSLAGHGTGAVDVLLGGERGQSSRIDTTSFPPEPPYALTFDGGPAGTGCAVVWLEIPFPPEATFRASPPPPAPR
jgi:hypothetical protein